MSLLKLGEQARLDQGSLQASRGWFEAAYSAAEAAGRHEQMARAALGLGGLWVHEHRATATAAGVEMRQRRALGLVNPKSQVALRLRIRLAAEADYRQGGHAAVLAAVGQADDGVALAEALSVAHHCLLGPDHAAKRLALADQLLSAGSRTGRRIDVLMGLLWRTVDLFLTADPQAERSFTELRGALAREDHLAIGFVASAIEVMLQIRNGCFETAERLAGACADRGAVAGDADADGWYGAQLVAIRWFQGRSAELVPTLSRLAHSPTLGVADNAYFAALAAAAGTAGDLRQAACALARLRGRDFRDLVRSSTWLVAMYGAIEAAHLLGDQQTSVEAYSLLRPFADLPLMGSLAVACFGSAHHGLGMASLTVGEFDRAVGHFRVAVCRNQALGHWPAVVLSRHRLGQALVARARHGDAALAATERAAAANEASRLGMVLPRPDARTSLRRPAASAAEPPVLPTCRRRGRGWQIQLAGRTATVADCVGMKYLATLFAHPGREIPAAELAAGPPAARSEPKTENGNGTGAPSRQSLLDDVAVHKYRRRLSQLDVDIEEYEHVNDLEQAAKARAERDWLIGELETSVGLGGRVRHFTDDTERARIAVGKAIRRALDRLAAADPVLGERLGSQVQTGLRCSFHPE